MTEDDLVYAATTRCLCGAGMAYNKFCRSSERYWECSAILLGKAKPAIEPDAVVHTGKLPFAFWEVLSEREYASHGATTRPWTKQTMKNEPIDNPQSRLTPEDMQGLETMIRRVVAEELAEIFPEKEKNKQ